VRERHEREKKIRFLWDCGILRGTYDPLSPRPRSLESDTPPKFPPRRSPTATEPRPSPTTIRSSRQHLISSPDIHAKQHERRNKPRDRAQPRRRKVRRVNIQRRIQHPQSQKGAERGIQSSCVVNNPVSIVFPLITPPGSLREGHKKTESNSQLSNPATFPANTAPMNNGAFSSPFACAASARSNRAYTSAGMAFLHAARKSTLRGDALFQKLLFARFTVAI
jgi:hypothetical protein